MKAKHPKFQPPDMGRDQGLRSLDCRRGTSPPCFMNRLRCFWNSDTSPISGIPVLSMRRWPTESCSATTLGLPSSRTSGRLGDSCGKKLEIGLVLGLPIRDDPDEIDVGALPDRFVIKGVHDWGSAIIVDDKRQVDWEPFELAFAKTLATVHGVSSREYWYTEIPPGLMIEERLVDELTASRWTLSCSCFTDGCSTSKSLTAASSARPRAFYDAQWTPLNARYRRSKLAPVLPRPASFIA